MTCRVGLPNVAALHFYPGLLSSLLLWSLELLGLLPATLVGTNSDFQYWPIDIPFRGLADLGSGFKIYAIKGQLKFCKQRPGRGMIGLLLNGLIG